MDGDIHAISTLMGRRMRKNVLTLALFIGWALSSRVSAQDQAFTDREVAGLMGPVKILRERLVDYQQVNNVFIESSTRETFSMRFNEAGNKPGSSAKTIHSETVHSPTENNTVYTEYTSTGLILRRQIYRYDSSNDLVEIVYYDASNQLTERDTYQYNDKHLVVSMLSYGSNNLFIGESRFEYNDDGRIKFRLDYSANQNLERAHNYQYREGKLTQYTFEPKNDHNNRQVRYEMDANKNRTIHQEEWNNNLQTARDIKASPISLKMEGKLISSVLIYSATHSKISSTVDVYNAFSSLNGQIIEKRNRRAVLSYDSQDRIGEEQYFDTSQYELEDLFTHVYTDRMHTIHNGKRRDGTLPAPSWIWEFNEDGLLVHYKTLYEEAYLAYDEHENLISRTEPLFPSRDVTWEYQYDSFGNWVKIDENHFTNDKLQWKRTYLRNIEYYMSTPVEDYELHEPVKTDR